MKNGVLKVLLILICFAIPISFICIGVKTYNEKYANKPNTNTEAKEEKSHLEILKETLNGKEKIQIKDEEGNIFDGNINEFKYYGKTFNIEETYATDLDLDGEKEIVALTDHDAGIYIVLHYEDENIYGYTVGIRTISDLKEDGTFMGSNGLNSKVYCRMTFNKTEYNIIELASYDDENAIYKINNEKVSKREVEQYIKVFERTEAAKNEK